MNTNGEEKGKVEVLFTPQKILEKIKIETITKKPFDFNKNKSFVNDTPTLVSTRLNDKLFPKMTLESFRNLEKSDFLDIKTVRLCHDCFLLVKLASQKDLNRETSGALNIRPTCSVSPTR